MRVTQHWSTDRPTHTRLFPRVRMTDPQTHPLTHTATTQLKNYQLFFSVEAQAWWLSNWMPKKENSFVDRRLFFQIMNLLMATTTPQPHNHNHTNDIKIVIYSKRPTKSKSCVFYRIGRLTENTNDFVEYFRLLFHTRIGRSRSSSPMNYVDLGCRSRIARRTSLVMSIKWKWNEISC